MNLFINDTPVRLVKDSEPVDSDVFDQVLRPTGVVDLHDFTGQVLLDNVPAAQVRQLMHQLMEEPFPEVSFVIRPQNYKQAKSDFMSLFKVVNAAGGVVEQAGRVLMIYRLGKWDFPKGKLEKGESFKKAAVREVEEETGLKVTLDSKICTTWHTYTFRKKRILKCTKWYAMDCVSDKHLAPQTEEDIEEVAWCLPGQVYANLGNSYNSIRFIWNSYQAKIGH